MGRSSVRRHKRELLVDRVFFDAAQNITQRYTAVFIGRRLLVSDNHLRVHAKIVKGKPLNNTVENPENIPVENQELTSISN